MWKMLAKKAVNKLGYELVRKPFDKGIRRDIFENIAQAYEAQLNETGRHIQQNKLRFELLTRLQGTRPAEAYFIIHSLEATKNIEGDVCEFGVAQGETSALIANEITSINKALHLFDSFEGLPSPSKEDQLKDDIFSLGSINAYAGTMSCPEQLVRERLHSLSFDRYHIHKGFIDAVLACNKDQLPRKVSFAYVDFDFYQPIKLALQFLHQTTSAGSIIIVDDYDFFSTGAKTAVDEFIGQANSNGAHYSLSVPEPRYYGYFAMLTRIHT